MNIDWSKAPEGADAYCSGYWLKKVQDDGYGFLMQPVNNGWEPVNFKPWKTGTLVYRSDDEKRKQEDEKAIALMSEELDIPRAVAERALSMGYRKFEILEEDV